MQDHNQQLEAYIRGQLHAGLAPDVISNHLQAAGWQAETVRAAFVSLQHQLMPSHFGALVPQAQHDAPGEQHAPHQTDPQLPVAAGSKRGRIRTGWELCKQSYRLLRANRYLLRYLLMMGLWIVGIELFYIALYVIYVLLSVTVEASRAVVFAMIVANYLTGYFFINLYAAGLAANVLDLFKGQRQPYAVYMRKARAKAGPIFMFSLLSATVGFILQQIAERLRWIGSLLSWVLGTLWSLGTLFVLPIVMDSPDKPGAIAAVRQSVRFFKQTWGENVTAKIAVTAPLALINIAFLCVTVALVILALEFDADALAIFFAAVWVIVAVLLSIIGTFATNLVNVALYYFARYRHVPPAFSAELLNSVFVPRKRRFFKKTTQA